MSQLQTVANKLVTKPVTISSGARHALLGLTGFSAFMIVKSELSKQSTKQLIQLKKERLSMVS